MASKIFRFNLYVSKELGEKIIGKFQSKIMEDYLYLTNYRL